MLIALLIVACTDDEPLPTCTELGAPDTLACNRGGLCEWEGVECCVAPVRGSEPDPKCAR